MVERLRSPCRLTDPITALVQGGAPQGMKFVDHEEVWHVNPDTGVGEWVPVAPQQ